MPTLTLNHTTMNNKLIAVSTPDGMVLRAKHPYLFLLLGTNKYTKGRNYYRFEKTVKSYKADFDCKEGQEFDEDSVELVWQVLDIVDSCWIECDNEEVAIAYKKYGLKIRQAYKLKTKPKEEQPTKETVEEAARKYAIDRYRGWGDHVSRDYTGTERTFKAGAQWMASQLKPQPPKED